MPMALPYGVRVLVGSYVQSSLECTSLHAAKCHIVKKSCDRAAHGPPKISMGRCLAAKNVD